MIYIAAALGAILIFYIIVFGRSSVFGKNRQIRVK